MSLSSKVVLNAIASVLQKSVRVLNQLFLIPFFITAWGAEYYGEWLTITIIPSILALSDFGLGTAASNTYILQYTSGQKKDALKTIYTGFIVVSIAIICSILISSVVLFFIYNSDLFSNSLINKIDAIISVSILILTNFVSFYLYLFEGFYIAERRATLSINLRTVFACLNIVSGLIVLLKGMGIVAFSSSQLLVAVLFNFYYGWKGQRLSKLEWELSFDKTQAKEIFRKGLGYLMAPIWQAIYFQGSTFVVRITLGPESVVVFNTVRTATRSINQLFNVIEAATLPEMQFAIGKGNFQDSKKLFSLSIWASFLIALAGGIALYYWGLDLYKVWTKNKLDVPLEMWRIFVLGLLFNSLWWTTGSTFKAYNVPYRFTIAGVFCAIISVFTTFLFSKMGGLKGAALGSIVLDISMAIYMLPYSLKLHNMTFSELLHYGMLEMNRFIKLVRNIIRV